MGEFIWNGNEFDYIIINPDDPTEYNCFITFGGSIYHDMIFSFYHGTPAWEHFIDSGLITVRPVRPAYHSWDDVNEEWFVDPVFFNPAMLTKLDTLRDAELVKPTMFTLDSTNFWIKNDQRTQNAIAAYDRAVAKENDEEYEVYFYAKDGDGAGANNIDVLLKGADIQYIDKELTRRMKHIFNAHKAVRDAHAVEMFTSLEDVETAFFAALA